jgi:hypothetical protein
MVNNTVVRQSFSEASVWRKALGNNEPLLHMAVSGYSLDATEYIPSGSTRKFFYGNVISCEQSTSIRG